MRPNSTWLSHEVWICKNHLPIVRYPAGTRSCWYYGCKSTRPGDKLRPAPVEVAPEPAPAPPPKPPEPEPEVEMCAWKDCGNAARPNSKYCSRNCSNKNARYRHRMRKHEDGAPV